MSNSVATEAMASTHLLRLEVPSRESLDRLATDGFPGLLPEPSRSEFCRDLYFDTPGQDLERRGVTVRLRFLASGICRFTVDVRERETDEGWMESGRATVEVPHAEPIEILNGDTEPGRLLRSLTDPARIMVRLELETRRRRRHARLNGDSDAILTLAFDDSTLRHDDLAADFQDLEIHFPEAEAAGVEELARTLEREHDLRVTLATKLARARELLERIDLGKLEAEVRAARQVAVLALRNRDVALLKQDDGLRVPAGQGSGEEACRHVLRAVFGRSRGDVRVLDTSAGLGARAAIEIWLARGVSEEEEGENPDLVWVPLDSALARVGSPELRETATLAALNLAARLNLSALDGDAPEMSTPPSGGSTEERAPFCLVPDYPTAASIAVPASESTSAGPDERLPPETLLNMELSEIAFDERVLALAEDENIPLLERVRFLSILGSNIDQFFVTRVAGYHRQLARGKVKHTMDGLTASQQLDAIGVRVRALFARAYRFFWDTLHPRLRAEGIHLVSWDELDEADRAYLTDNYAAQLGGVLMPLAADSSHPFPHLRNLRPALGLLVRTPDSAAEHFAAIELPSDLPRFIPLPGGRRFVPLEDVIRASFTTLYPGLDILEAHVFRVTRSADVETDDDVGDLLQAVQEQVFRRPLGPVIRLEVQDSMPESMRRLLLRELQFESAERVSTLRDEDVYAVDRLVDLYGLRQVAELPFDELHYPPLSHSSPLDPRRSVWEILRERDALVRFPFDSFERTVERVLAEAASDESVTSIKITLYRTNRSSRVVQYLRQARRKGKDVLAVVELKASFDEQRNIEWARALESSGIHVVYGPADLKVHAKILLIARREGDDLRRYLYIGTGNLNAATASGYTDLGLFTSHPEFGDDVHEVFNALSGYTVRAEYRRLLVAPFNMRERFVALLDREITHARAGREGRVTVKINGLTDIGIISKLYEASAAGVKIEMMIRGICCLRPGVPGLSENIGVISLLGRFLEHSRIFRFHNDGDAEYYIGSADWRPRNLSRRVEVVAPVTDARLRATLDDVLTESLANPAAWELRPDGSYARRTSAA